MSMSNAISPKADLQYSQRMVYTFLTKAFLISSALSETVVPY